MKGNLLTFEKEKNANANFSNKILKFDAVPVCLLATGNWQSPICSKVKRISLYGVVMNG